MTENINKDIRKLVSLKTIDRVKPIEGADMIELVIIGGWQVVTKKGEYKAGDKVLYFEIDSFLPSGIPQFQFLVDKSSKTVMSPKNTEVTGHILKSIRLRGEVSQGFVLPMSDFPDLEREYNNSSDTLLTPDEKISHYFDEIIGVFKYEKPIPVSGNIIGQYPNHTIKTDSERVQNLTNEFLQNLLSEGKKIVATEKVDGQSTTWWKDKENKLHVASRNYELDLNSDPALVEIAKRYDLYNVLLPNETIKAELYGEGIQSNPLKVQGKHLSIFDWELDGRELPSELIPHLAKSYDFELPNTVEETVKQVDKLGSLINPNVQAEGVVWWIYPKTTYKELGYRSNFKAINNSYLLKHGG